MLQPSHDTIAEIAKEVTKLAPLEQQLLLTKLRVRRVRKKGIQKITNTPKNIRKPTLQQIDKWKHESKSKA